MSAAGWMNAAFLALIATHTAHAVVSNMRASLKTGDETNVLSDTIRGRRARLFMLAVQLPMFYLACALGHWRHGVFSRELVSPLHMGMGLLAGHMVFGVSLLITHRCLRDAWEHFRDLTALWDYALESPVVFGRFLLVAFSEELIWRVAFQPMLANPLEEWASRLLGPGYGFIGVWLAIAVVAFLFAVSHKHFFENSLLVSLEFLGFALLLGALYHWTGSFILVVVIHAMRDIEITYLEYCIKVDELGDAELAAREVENALIRHPHVERT